MKFRPRFSLRALAVLVTLVCAYFASWKPTQQAAKRQIVGIYSLKGTSPIFDQFSEAQKVIDAIKRREELVWVVQTNSPMPLVISRREVRKNKTIQAYYLWLFGPQFKLPFEGE